MHTRTVTLSAPLDHERPSGPSIDVFARIVTGRGGEQRPYLVYLQGGPGQEAPRPDDDLGQPPWLARALEDYQVVMLDQRGTGNSTPVGDPSTVPGDTAAEKAQYLTHLRADAIVRDCELLRAELGAERLSLLGQSFGGFTSVAYLSMFPDSLAEVFITGGLTPVGRHADDVYLRTYAAMQRKSEEHYRRFPDDRDRLRRALDACREGRLRLPGGDAVTPGLLRSIGHRLGMTGGSLDVHHLLERDPQSPAFSYDLAGMLPFSGRNPLYAVFHESSYADGMATRWSADRVRPAAFEQDETLLTGEHLSRWHFDVCSDLTPWREVADVVAEHEWPRLYDPGVLARATAKVAAIAYHDDAYVDVGFSQETADLIAGAQVWITNEWEHNGLRVAGARVLDRLISLTR